MGIGLTSLKEISFGISFNDQPAVMTGTRRCACDFGTAPLSCEWRCFRGKNKRRFFPLKLSPIPILQNSVDKGDTV
jgi:hypothetical protein